jgi:predicted aldo/keto reductase-like oxidoreductase
LHDYRDQGIIRHIGFTGHSSSDAMKRVAELYDFEVMMIAMNHHRHLPFEENALPYAAKKGIGVVAMKVIRPRENIEGLSPDTLIRYALSFKDFSLANISNSSMSDLKENLVTIRNFKPLDSEEMKNVQAALSPFYRHENLAWMDPGYIDGAINPDGLDLMV